MLDLTLVLEDSRCTSSSKASLMGEINRCTGSGDVRKTACFQANKFKWRIEIEVRMTEVEARMKEAERRMTEAERMTLGNPMVKAAMMAHLLAIELWSSSKEEKTGVGHGDVCEWI